MKILNFLLLLSFHTGRVSSCCDDCSNDILILNRELELCLQTLRKNGVSLKPNLDCKQEKDDSCENRLMIMAAFLQRCLRSCKDIPILTASVTPSAFPSTLLTTIWNKISKESPITTLRPIFSSSTSPTTIVPSTTTSQFLTGSRDTTTLTASAIHSTTTLRSTLTPSSTTTEPLIESHSTVIPTTTTTIHSTTTTRLSTTSKPSSCIFPYEPNPIFGRCLAAIPVIRAAGGTRKDINRLCLQTPGSFPITVFNAAQNEELRRLQLNKNMKIVVIGLQAADKPAPLSWIWVDGSNSQFRAWDPRYPNHFEPKGREYMTTVWIKNKGVIDNPAISWSGETATRMFEIAAKNNIHIICGIPYKAI